MQVALLLSALEEAYKKIDILEGALVEAQKIIEEKEEVEGVEEASSRKMDSHVKNLNTRQIEEELGGLLFTGQFSCENTTHAHGQQQSSLIKISIGLGEIFNVTIFTRFFQSFCKRGNMQSVIISREGLILTLSILPCPQGRIF